MAMSFSLQLCILFLTFDDCMARATAKLPRDVYGDPLPFGATARFGSIRWRIPKAVEAVAVSHDGKLVAAFNMEGTVVVWDRKDGRPVHEIKASAGSIAFSPDGKYLATGGGANFRNADPDLRIRLWDLKTGRVKSVFPPVKGTPISRLVFTSDSKLLISAGFGHPVTVWKSPSGDKVHEFPTDQGQHYNVALSPDDKWLAVSENDLFALSIYSLDGFRKLRRIKSPSGYFATVAFSPDGKSLLTYQSDRICTWDVAKGKTTSTIRVENEILREVVFTPDAKKAAMMGSSREIEWLDLSTGKKLESWKDPREKPDISTGVLNISPDGKLLAVGNWGTVKLWDTATGKVVQQPTQPNEIPFSVRYSTDGKSALVACHECIYLLDGKTLTLRKRIPIQVGSEYRPWTPIAISPDGGQAALLDEKDEPVLLDLGNPANVRKLAHAGPAPRNLVFSPDGKRLFGSPPNSTGIWTWDVATGKAAASLAKEATLLTNVSIARNAEKLAVVVKGEKPTCRFWNLRTNKEEPSLELEWNRGTIGPDSIEMSDGGKWLVVYYFRQYLRVWDLTTRTERFDFPWSFEDGPGTWAFSPDSKYLVTSHNRVIRSWNLESGEKVAELRGHKGEIFDLAFSPDGEALVSTCNCCSVIRWQKSAWQGRK